MALPNALAELGKKLAALDVTEVEALFKDRLRQELFSSTLSATFDGKIQYANTQFAADPDYARTQIVLSLDPTKLPTAPKKKEHVMALIGEAFSQYMTEKGIVGYPALDIDENKIGFNSSVLEKIDPNTAHNLSSSLYKKDRLWEELAQAGRESEDDFTSMDKQRFAAIDEEMKKASQGDPYVQSLHKVVEQFNTDLANSRSRGV